MRLEARWAEVGHTLLTLYEQNPDYVAPTEGPSFEAPLYTYAKQVSKLPRDMDETQLHMLRDMYLPAMISMVCTELDHPLFPNLPVVLFPGNVGDVQALATVYQRLCQ